ncbi:MAG TPA: MopE-related protein, partial [Myxococcota bacterium]|nr:MopE-related protein [Myxococcota bacterium]
NTTTLSAPSGCANLFTADSGESFNLSGFRLLNSGNRLLYLVNADASLADLALSGAGNINTLSGAGIYASGGSLQVSDSSFSSLQGYYGGAIYSLGGNVASITDSSFTSNTGYYGGAVLVGAGSSLSLVGSSFASNLGWYGGGAVWNSGDVSSSGSSYLSNRGYYAHGAAIYLDNGATLDSAGDSFTDNYANYYTSGYHGGAIYGYRGNTIRVQSGSFSGNYAYQGGAIYVNTGTLDLQDSTLNNNHGYVQGGAIYGYSSTLTVDGSDFTTNSSTYSHGGAIYGEYVDLTVSGSDFTSNSAYYYGGAIFQLYTGNLNLSDSSFTGHTATYGYGGSVYAQALTTVYGSGLVESSSLAYYDGGAFYLYNISGGADIQDSSFSSNRSTYGSGGALRALYTDLSLQDVELVSNYAYYSGPGVAVDSSSDLSYRGGTVRDNSSTYGYGGGIYFASANTEDVQLQNVTIADNRAAYHGGGAYIFAPRDVEIEGCAVQENQAGSSYYGGGLYLYQSRSVAVDASTFCGNQANQGGGVYHYYAYGGASSDHWANNVFVENQASGYGGAFLSSTNYYQEFVNNTLVGNRATLSGGSVYLYLTYADFTNNIIAYTMSGDGVVGADSGTATYSDFLYNDWYVNASADRSGTLSFSTSANGNQTVDPRFDSYSLDGNCSNDALNLAAGSPLIDAGHPAYRDPDGSVSDVGAYGGPGAAVFDADGDGSLSTVDCDDNNANIYPGATESCNGVDDDCDGVVDESGSTGEQVWYADGDVDTFGDAGSSSTGCT